MECGSGDDDNDDDSNMSFTIWGHLLYIVMTPSL